MLISLHKQARTTPKIRAAIQASKEPAWIVSERYGISDADGLEMAQAQQRPRPEPHGAPASDHPHADAGGGGGGTAQVATVAAG